MTQRTKEEGNDMVTIFALGRDGRVATVEVANTSRGEVEPALAGAWAAAPGGAAWFVDTSDPQRPRWAVSYPGSEGLVDAADVPPIIRVAGEAWLVDWAGRDCGREWAAQSDTVRPDTYDMLAYRQWCDAQDGLPATGDLEFLADVIGSIAGREPTDDEIADFRSALLSELWDRTPVDSA